MKKIEFVCKENTVIIKYDNGSMCGTIKKDLSANQYVFNASFDVSLSMIHLNQILYKLQDLNK